MEDGVIEELDYLFVITFIKTLFWCFASYILHSLMVILDKSILLIGYPCSIILFGLPGLAFLLLYLIE